MTIIRTKRRGLRRLGGFNKARGRGREQGIRGFRTRVPWLWGWWEEGAGRVTPTSVSGFPATSGNEKGVHCCVCYEVGVRIACFFVCFFFACGRPCFLVPFAGQTDFSPQTRLRLSSKTSRHACEPLLGSVSSSDVFVLYPGARAINPCGFTVSVGSV